MPKRPEPTHVVLADPIAYTDMEGAYWRPFKLANEKPWDIKKGRIAGRLFALLFSNGAILDQVCGWRPRQYWKSKEELQEILEIWKEKGLV